MHMEIGVENPLANLRLVSFAHSWVYSMLHYEKPIIQTLDEKQQREDDNIHKSEAKLTGSFIQTNVNKYRVE